LQDYYALPLEEDKSLLSKITVKTVKATDEELGKLAKRYDERKSWVGLPVEFRDNVHVAIFECSVSKMWDLFFSDNATYPFTDFQADCLPSSNQTLSDWSQDYPTQFSALSKAVEADSLKEAIGI
jgi:hypothetical protein